MMTMFTFVLVLINAATAADLELPKRGGKGVSGGLGVPPATFQVY